MATIEEEIITPAFYYKLIEKYSATLEQEAEKSLKGEEIKEWARKKIEEMKVLSEGFIFDEGKPAENIDEIEKILDELMTEFGDDF